MSALPVHLVTGFLGSGKTTLLSSLIRQPGFADTAVVVNELGEVGLDHLLVTQGSESDVVLLDSGCLCCALGNSLQETLESLYFRRVRGEVAPFARVVVETTGMADPGPIAATLGLDGAIARHYRLGSIVTVCDALHAPDQVERFPEAMRQVAMADRLVLTKGDLAGDAAVKALASHLSRLNPHAAQVQAIAGDITADEVLVDALHARALERYAALDACSGASHGDRGQAHGHVIEHERDQDHAAAGVHDHLAERRVGSTAIRLAAPLDWPRYADWVAWLQRTLGERLLRMKGAVRMSDGTFNALHAVMRLFSPPVALPALPAELGDGVIVLITQDAPDSLLSEAKRRIEAPSLTVTG